MEGFKFETKTAKTAETEKQMEKPWEKLREQEEGLIIDEYCPSEISPDTREKIDQILNKEINEKRIAFANEWFFDHQDEIEEKGYNSKAATEQEIMKIVSELGIFSGKEWREDKNIENLYALRFSAKKEKVPIESQYLILNILDRKRNQLELAIELKKGDRAERKIAKRQAKEILGVEKTIVEKLSGRSFAEEAETKVYGKGLRRYINYFLSGASLHIPTVVGEIQKRRLRKRIIREAAGAYSEIAEKAAGGIESIYNRVKEGLITEFITKELRKDEKGKEELDAIQKEFGETRQKVDVNKFLDSIIHQKKGLEGLQGDWQKDEGKIKEFLSNFEIPADNLGLSNPEIDQIKQNYSRVVKKKKRFLQWFMELTIYLDKAFDKK